MNNKNIIAVRNLIRCLDKESLKNPEVVANLVRAFGIVQWGPDVFGADEVFKNATPEMAGIYQTPDQIAKAFAYLSDFKINSYIEIGVFQGGNFIFVSEYLRRFNPKIKCTGIDPTDYLNPEIAAIISAENWLSFLPCASDAISGQIFDLAFIDGEHTSAWVNADWNNIGNQAKICMFHDIQETTCPDVVKFWSEIKAGTKKKYAEFLDHSSAIPIQGIGIIHNSKTGKR